MNRKFILCDFEFSAVAGERPTPICMVARELPSGKLIRLWFDELKTMNQPPFDVTEGSIFVSFYSSAEISCFLQLGWPTPVLNLDLFTEFRCLTNGRIGVGSSLLSALKYFGLPCIDAVEKEEMRQLAIRGGPFTPAEKGKLLDYCQTDVDALEKLLPVMLPGINLQQAVYRGRYMISVARMEHCGTPIDMDSFYKIQDSWEALKEALVEKLDVYCLFEGITFKKSRFADLLVFHGVAWPRLPTGSLDLSDEIFKSMCLIHPQFNGLRELRAALSKLRLTDLAVGADGRNRTMLSAFRSTTSRNQPSNSKFCFGPSTWIRSLIKPTKGRAVAYVDYSQQEFGIAAALSGDLEMQEAYKSGDPYLTFAKQANAVPQDATKHSHKRERELFKQCVLAVQYGMAAESLAFRTGQSTFEANELLRLHRSTFRKFWQWSDQYVNSALLSGVAETVFGWKLHVDDNVNLRSLANFPMQANGAEILRLACCLLTEKGISVCAPVHDAVLVECDSANAEEACLEVQRLLQHASEVVLDGFSLKSDVELVKYPGRYVDPRGISMWNAISEQIGLDRIGG